MLIPNPYIPAPLYPLSVTQMTTRTYNGVPKREFLAMYKLEKELYEEWNGNRYDIDAHNRLRGAMNVLAMCLGEESRMDLIHPE